MKKVSIIIPCFNQAHYLQACIDHCWYQTYPNIELVIVDGGSTDATKTMLQALSEKIQDRETSPVLRYDEHDGIVRKACRTYLEDTHVTHPGRELHILSYEHDLGRTGTYNAGFRKATGEYCTYIVGDDMPHPHMIEELVHALEQTEADVAYSDFRVVNDQGHILRQVRKPSYDFTKCFAEWFHLGVSTLHRRTLHQKVGIMDEAWQHANDYEWYLRMAESGATFTHVPKVLYSVRFHGHGVGLDEESIRLAQKARSFTLGAPSQ